MSIFNRRNAALGWAAWLVGKRLLKRKGKAAAAALDTGSPQGGAAFDRHNGGE